LACEFALLPRFISDCYADFMTLPSPIQNDDEDCAIAQIASLVVEQAEESSSESTD
jgi:hypothetical protein